MKLEKILNLAELSEFNSLLLEPPGRGPGVICYYALESSLVVIGVCENHELIAWYCAPARCQADALFAREVLFAGIQGVNEKYERPHAKAMFHAQLALEKAMGTRA
jgi:hypothetical protein